MKHWKGLQKLSVWGHKLVTAVIGEELGSFGSPAVAALGDWHALLEDIQPWPLLHSGHEAGPCLMQSASSDLAM